MRIVTQKCHFTHALGVNCRCVGLSVDFWVILSMGLSMDLSMDLSMILCVGDVGLLHDVLTRSSDQEVDLSRGVGGKRDL